MLEPPLDTGVSKLLLLETRRTYMRYNPSRGPVTPSGCQHSVAFSRRCAGITRDFLRWAFFSGDLRFHLITRGASLVG
jgi:hypothetical protein